MTPVREAGWLDVANIVCLAGMVGVVGGLASEMGARHWPYLAGLVGLYLLHRCLSRAAERAARIKEIRERVQESRGR